MSVSSLCVAANVPATTALRWVGVLTDEGWLVRRQDPADGRRVWLELSTQTQQSLRLYLEQMAERWDQCLRVSGSAD